MKLKVKKWYFIVIAIITILVWIRWDGKKEEDSDKKYCELIDELKKPMPLDKACSLWQDAYDNARSDNKRRECIGQLILCYEQKGDLYLALRELTKYEEEFEESAATSIHKANLLNTLGRQLEGKHILDSISSTPILFVKPSFWAQLVDIGSTKDSMNEAYLNYIYEYVCRLVALSYRAGMESDSLKRLECLCRFDSLESADRKLKEYHDFCERNPETMFSSSSSNLYKLIQIMQRTHLYLFQNFWNPENAVVDACRMKWIYLQMYLDEYDRCWGYEKAAEHFKRLLSDNSLASEGYQRFLFDAYMEALNKDSKYKMSYPDYKSLYRNGFGWLVKLSPTTLSGKPSAFINAGVTKPCILISCNDWNVCDSTLFNVGDVLEDRGKEKRVVILKDDFTTDTLRIDEDYLGVNISYRPVGSMTLDLVRRLASEK